jgi:penicillin-binding protein 1A
LKSVTGGGTPARIWRNFMARAIKGAAPLPKAKPLPTKPVPDPEGPILPMDLPEIPDIPIDVSNGQVGLDENQNVRIQADIGGFPLDLRFGKDGVSLGDGRAQKPPEKR